MRRLVSLALVCVLAAPASADGLYVTEGFGGIDVKDELGAYIDGAVRIRLALGVRRKNLALEGWIAGAIGSHSHGEAAIACRSTDGGSNGCSPDSYDGHGGTGLMMWGMDLKYLQPVARHVDVYVRGSASKAYAGSELDGYAGRGLGVGAGVQLKGKVRAIGFLWWPLFFVPAGPKVTAALWLDAGYDFYRLHGDRGSVDGQLHSLTAGFAVGSDF